MTTQNALRQLEKRATGPIRRVSRSHWIAPVGERLVEIMADSCGPDYPDGYDPTSRALIGVVDAEGLPGYRTELFRVWREALAWATR